MNIRYFFLAGSFIIPTLSYAMDPSASLLAGSAERVAYAATALVGTAATTFGLPYLYNKTRTKKVVKAEEAIDKFAYNTQLNPNQEQSRLNANYVLMRYQAKLAALGLAAGLTVGLSQLLAFKAFDGHQFSEPAAYTLPLIQALAAGVAFTAIDPSSKDPYADEHRCLLGLAGWFLWVMSVTQTINRVYAGK